MVSEGARPWGRSEFAKFGRAPKIQIYFEPRFWRIPEFGRRKQKCFFPVFPSFCNFDGLKAISKPAPSPVTHQLPVETLSEISQERKKHINIKKRNEQHLKNEKATQRVSLGAGYPADVHVDIPAGAKTSSGPRSPGKTGTNFL